MKDITVRQARETDAAAIAGLLTQVGKVHSEGRPDIYRPHITKHNARSVSAMISGGIYKLFVAESEGKVIGELICRVQERDGDAFYRPRKWLYVDDLCVGEEARGSEAAPLLMGAAENYARDLGCAAVELNCWAFNKRAARFYEKAGYVPQRTEYEKKIK